MVRFSSLLYRSNEITLTIYKSKPRKKIFILSLKHKIVKIRKSEKGLPETVEFYNKTKFGVDIADQMAKKYSVKSGSRKWSLQVFFNILDLAGINAWILYREITGEQISRKEFMFQLADELAADNEKSRVKQRASEVQSTSKNSRKCCQIGYYNNNKTTIICNVCKKYACGKCTQNKVNVCKKCYE